MVFNILWKTNTMNILGFEPKLIKCEFAVLPVKLFLFLLWKKYKYIYILSVLKDFILQIYIVSKILTIKVLLIWFLDDLNTEDILIKNTLYQLS
jgi:hypothetical protein